MTTNQRDRTVHTTPPHRDTQTVFARRARGGLMGLAITACILAAAGCGSSTLGTPHPPPTPTSPGGVSTANSPFNGTANVVYTDGYQFRVNYTLSVGAPSTDTLNVPPGQVSVSESFTGSVVVTNTTAGHNAQSPGVSFIGIWESNSVMCPSRKGSIVTLYTVQGYPGQYCFLNHASTGWIGLPEEAPNQSITMPAASPFYMTVNEGVAAALQQAMRKGPDLYALAFTVSYQHDVKGSACHDNDGGYPDLLGASGAQLTCTGTVKQL